MSSRWTGLFLLFLFAPGAGWTQDPGDPPARVVILPYTSPQAETARTYDYALFAIPDLLKEKLEATGRFKVLSGPGTRGTEEPSPPAPEEGLDLARSLEADFLVWGYILASQQGLKVVHRVVQVVDGTLSRVETQDLPTGPALIDALEASSLRLSQSMAALPPPPPRVVVVETLKEVPVSGSLRKSNLELALGITGYGEPYNGWVAPAGLIKMELTYPWGENFSLGTDVMIQRLVPQEGLALPPEESFSLLYFPILLKAGAHLVLLDFLQLGWDLKGGSSLLVGTFHQEGFLVFRPSWGTGATVAFWPKETLSLRLHLDYLGTWLTFEGEYLASLRLSFGLGMNF